MYECASAGRRSGCEDVLALVLANGRGRTLEGLTAWQTKAAVPFAGQYRIVDFVLSNCVNSEIRRIALLTQYKSQSLIRHVHSGWGFLHGELGEFVQVWPAQQQDGARWYRGSVDAVWQNSDLIEATGSRHVLLLADDQIYALDYSLLVESHIARSADITIACAHARGAEQIALRGPDDRIEKIVTVTPGAAATFEPELAPMGVFLFSADFLAQLWRDGRAASAAGDFARDLVPSLAGCARVFAYVCDTAAEPCYWRTLNTIDRYWSAHMELLDNAELGVHAQAGWPIFTRYESLPAARVLRNAHVDGAILSPGAVVAGDVKHSVISSRCRVDADAVVTDSVLLPGAVVGAGCVLDRVVVDADCVLAPDTRLGERVSRDAEPHSTPNGIVLSTAARSASNSFLARHIA